MGVDNESVRLTAVLLRRVTLQASTIWESCMSSKSRDGAALSKKRRLLFGGSARLSSRDMRARSTTWE